MLNAYIIFNAFLLATRLSKCRGTACAVRILNRRLPIIIIIIGIITTDLYRLSLSRETLYSPFEITFALLFTEELEALQSKIYCRATPKALWGKAEVYIKYVHLHLLSLWSDLQWCKSGAVFLESVHQTRHSTNANQCSSLTLYKNLTDVIQARGRNQALSKITLCPYAVIHYKVWSQCLGAPRKAKVPTSLHSALISNDI